VFENRVLRRTSGPKRDEVAGSWRKIHNEKLYNLYCSPNIIRLINSKRTRWAEYVAQIRKERNAHGIFVGKAKGKRQP
jgi:hypothetical protein